MDAVTRLTWLLALASQPQKVDGSLTLLLGSMLENGDAFMCWANFRSKTEYKLNPNEHFA